MQKYSEYKDSGNYIVGDIPQSWETRRLKYICSGFNNGTSATQIEPSADTVPVTRIESISSGTINFDKVGNIEYSESIEKYRLNKGDILFSHINSYERVGNTAVYYGETPLFHGMNLLRLRPKPKSNNHFLYHYLKSLPCILQVQRKCKPAINQVSVPTSVVREILIPYPPLSEQQAIVSYLDDKCGKIDQLLENKAKELELLAEIKQRVIADAVTKGLNPDVTMRDSGIPWLPQIPEHWGCAKLKAFCKDNKEKNKGNVESQVLSLSYGRVIVKQNINFGLVPDSYETYQIVNPGYIILRLTDLQNDHKSLRTGLVKDRGIITSAYVGLIVNNMDSSYAQLVLHSYDIMKVFYRMGGGLRQSMSYQDIANLYIPIPPIDEQKAIVAHIEEKVSKIDALADKLQKEIESIKEYKQRLTSDVVTGQIKVC